MGNRKACFVCGAKLRKNNKKGVCAHGKHRRAAVIGDNEAQEIETEEGGIDFDDIKLEPGLGKMSLNDLKVYADEYHRRIAIVDLLMHGEGKEKAR